MAGTTFDDSTGDANPAQIIPFPSPNPRLARVIRFPDANNRLAKVIPLADRERASGRSNTPPIKE